MKYITIASTVAVLSTNIISVLATPMLFPYGKRADTPCTNENVTFNVGLADQGNRNENDS